LPDKPKFPNAYLQLSGEDSNLGSIMGRGSQLLKDIDQPQEVIVAWRLALMAGTYQDALRTCAEWFDVG
jgi:hypothetical protein